MFRAPLQKGRRRRTFVAFICAKTHRRALPVRSNSGRAGIGAVCGAARVGVRSDRVRRVLYPHLFVVADVPLPALRQPARLSAAVGHLYALPLLRNAFR